MIVQTMSRFVKLEFGERGEERATEAKAARDEVSYLGEAQAAFLRGDFEAALRAYARVLEFNPQNVTAWSGQVRMLIELGEFREARLWADKALERFGHDAELLAAKAVALGRLGELTEAMALSDAAVEERGDTPYVWLARGDVLLARAEKRADYCFTKALAGAPQQWLWPWLASRIHYYYQKFSLALKYIAEALALDAGQSVIWLQMGRCQLALGMASAARNSIDQARQLNPHCLEVQTALVELQEQGLWERLRGALRQWFRR
jgi:tetratricopeptide (TPR) repeat protein